jgi:hypothetical protein
LVRYLTGGLGYLEVTLLTSYNLQEHKFCHTLECKGGKQDELNKRMRKQVIPLTFLPLFLYIAPLFFCYEPNRVLGLGGVDKREGVTGPAQVAPELRKGIGGYHLYTTFTDVVPFPIHYPPPHLPICGAQPQRKSVG